MNTANTQNKQNDTYKINFTALFTWLAVFVVTGIFWCGIALALKQDYVPRAIAKLQHKEQRFLDNHKGLQKKISNISNLLS